MPGGSSFELADIGANARRGKNAAAISPIALSVKRVDALFEIERGINGAAAAARPQETKRAGTGGSGVAWLRERTP
jgi:transposase